MVEHKQRQVKKMVDLSKADNIIHTPTSVNCESREIKCCWRSLSSLLASLVTPPCCCRCRCSSQSESEHNSRGFSTRISTNTVVKSTVVGTLFGHRKGKVTMCIQEDTNKAPIVMLELAMPTFLLVKEMSSGLLRIAMECERDPSKTKPLLTEPVWTMYCNGRKVGFAVRRQLTDSDKAVLTLMGSVSMGAGVIPVPNSDGEEEPDELMYMRATYERIVGSPDSESFHMINPDGSPGQELSIFLLRA